VATNSAKTTKQSAGVLNWLVIVLVLLVGAGGYWLGHARNAQQKEAIHNVVSVPFCKASNLSLSQGKTDGAAGTLYKHAVVTNNGSSMCRLTGYPAAFLLDSGGAAPNPLYPITNVNVSAGGKAHVVLAFPEAANFDPPMCSAVSATVQLYLPGEVTPLSTAWADHYCPGFTVTAFQSGS
jgi:hypothetical protein